MAAVAARWLAMVVLWLAGAARAEVRPNLLWITSEDHGPHLGCYGDPVARTPNVDALAARGLRYTRVWSCAPVCAPARSVLISGLHAGSAGAEAMRSQVPYPRGQKMFPQLLREAGYWCSNNSKEDYNLEKPGKVWDESSNRAHWRQRAPGQPFFAVFNSTRSHESQIRSRPHVAVLDPARVRVPPYHPDLPEVRRDWAQYYDQVSAADAEAGRVLAQLEADGLREDTIVFYFSDHGSGMPRHKRWLYDAGLHVPLVVHLPAKFKHLRPPGYAPGAISDRQVSFVDFAPTVLSLAGIRPPAYLQGRAFLGPHAGPAPGFLFGGRSRMDERIDLSRSVTDGRFVYIRNYLPHRPQGQHLAYLWETPTTRVWEAAHRAGTLTPAQDAFWQPKPAEELYDLHRDPDEVDNRADDRALAAVKRRLKSALREHLVATRDTGFLPEGEMWRRAAGGSPYDGLRKSAGTDIRRVYEAAERAAGREAGAATRKRLRRDLADGDPAVRYWAATGLLIRVGSLDAADWTALRGALEDASPEVRVPAAEALIRGGAPEDGERARKVLLELAGGSRDGLFPAILALNALTSFEGPGELGEAVRRWVADPGAVPAVPQARYTDYVPRLRERLTELVR